MKPILLFSLLICFTTTVMAQRKIIVVDFETGLPVKGVSVRCDRSAAVLTNYLGEAKVQQMFDSISFSHVEYTPEKLAYSEIEDTMFLLPLRYSIDEVVVVGINSDRRRQMERIHENQIYQKPISGFSFNLGLILDKRTRRDRKHQQRAKDVLRKWDAK